jgi:hypothetical protein
MFDEVLAKSGGGDYMDTDTFVQVAQAHNLLSPEALRLRRERYALRKQTKSRPIPSVDAKSSLDILTAVFDNMGEDVRDIEKSKFEDRSHQEYLENKRRNNDHERQLLLLRTKGKVDENETDSLAQAKLKAFVSAFDVYVQTGFCAAVLFDVSHPCLKYVACLCVFTERMTCWMMIRLLMKWCLAFFPKRCTKA